MKKTGRGGGRGRGLWRREGKTGRRRRRKRSAAAASERRRRAKALSGHGAAVSPAASCRSSERRRRRRRPGFSDAAGGPRNDAGEWEAGVGRAHEEWENGGSRHVTSRQGVGLGVLQQGLLLSLPPPPSEEMVGGTDGCLEGPDRIRAGMKGTIGPPPPPRRLTCLFSLSLYKKARPSEMGGGEGLFFCLLFQSSISSRPPSFLTSCQNLFCVLLLFIIISSQPLLCLALPCPDGCVGGGGPGC